MLLGSTDDVVYMLFTV